MLRSLMVVALLAATVPATDAAGSGVETIEDAPWSPDDAARDGAAELAILLRLASPERPAGFVGIGDGRGLFQRGTHRGLELAVWSGVPVVRVTREARGGLAVPDSWFIDAGARGATEAADLLAQCLARHGPFPAARTPFAPSAAERAALRRHLALYQAEFNRPSTRLVAR